MRWAPRTRGAAAFEIGTYRTQEVGMNKRLVKWSLAAGLALLLALPAIAYSQLEGPRGPRFAPGEQGAAGPGAMGAGRQGGPQRFANAPPAQGPRGARGAMSGARQEARGAVGRGRPGPRPGIGPRGMGGRHIGLAEQALAQADRIGLSAEQRDRILAAQRSNQEAAINRRAAEQIGRLELRDLMDAEARDVAAIEAKLRELAEQDIAGTVAALRLDAQVGEILSAEQSEALREAAGERGRSRPGRGSRRIPR
jgi:Spy/CpxP family protein refolding chaperone